MKRLVLIFFSSVLSGTVLAHHSTAIYDMEQSITIEGVVSRYDWANPHVYIYIEQRTETGSTTEWKVEGYPPALMRRMGWSDQTLQLGDSIMVKGNPTRNASSSGIYPETIEATGRTLFQQRNFRGQLSRVSVEPDVAASSLEGTWETLIDVELILYFYNPGMELTADGTVARASYDERTMLPALDCIPYSAPLLMIDPDFKQIIIEENLVTIQGGYAPATRTIYLADETPDESSRTIQGYSTGRWEGDSLVIDTTRFSDHRIGNGYRGIASGEHKHLVERLTLNEQGTRLIYEFELTDPEYLNETVRGEVEWGYRPDLEFVREECESDNARRFIGE